MNNPKKKLPVVNSPAPKPLQAKKKLDFRKPLTSEELKEIRKQPTASYLDLVRLLDLYDETREEVKRAQDLSSIHYQHHVDTMEMYREMKKKFEDANEAAELSVKRMAKANVEVAEAAQRAEEAETSREFMCSEAGRYDNIKNKILEHIEASKIVYTYDSMTKKNDVMVKFSKLEFDKLVSSLEVREEDFG